MGQDVGALIKDLGFQQAILIAHSMGGKAAMHLALEQPNLIDSMVILDVAPSGYPHIFTDHCSNIKALHDLPLHDGSIKSRADADAHLAAQIPNPNVRKFLLRGLIFDENHVGRWEYNVESMVNNMEDIILFQPSLDMTPFPRPVLFLRGLRSEYMAEQYMPFTRALFPLMHVVGVENSTHVVHIDNPDKMVREAVAFISQRFPPDH